MRHQEDEELEVEPEPEPILDAATAERRAAIKAEREVMGDTTDRRFVIDGILRLGRHAPEDLEPLAYKALGEIYEENQDEINAAMELEVLRDRFGDGDPEELRARAELEARHRLAQIGWAELEVPDSPEQIQRAAEAAALDELEIRRQEAEGRSQALRFTTRDDVAAMGQRRLEDLEAAHMSSNQRAVIRVMLDKVIASGMSEVGFGFQDREACAQYRPDGKPMPARSATQALEYVARYADFFIRVTKPRMAENKREAARRRERDLPPRRYWYRLVDARRP